MPLFHRFTPKIYTSNAVIFFYLFNIYLFFCSAETLSELRENLKAVIEALTKAEGSVTSISSGCELFLRFITLASLDNPVCNTLLYKAVYANNNMLVHLILVGV